MVTIFICPTVIPVDNVFDYEPYTIYTQYFDFEMDPVEACFRASVAVALDETNAQAACILGLLHCRQDLPESSFYLASYYLNAAANENKGRAAICQYIQSLLRLTKHIHEDQYLVQGFNVIPAMIFWLRKSSDLGDDGGREMLKKWEKAVQKRCGCCSKTAKIGEKFKQCSKCRAQWYCSKECQIEAWRDGYKKDCRRARILKFEDYLNAE